MAQVIHIDTGNTSYIMDVLPTGQLRHLYYGKRLRHQFDYSALAQKDDVPGYGTLVAHSQAQPNIGLDDQCLEHSGLGKGDFREPMIDLVFQDGSMTTDFRYVSHKSEAGRPGYSRTAQCPGRDRHRRARLMRAWLPGARLALPRPS
jgi:alpha-galactosidase